MAFLRWRAFNFFDKELVTFPENDDIFAQLKQANVTACASGRGSLIFGDCEGCVYIVSKSLELSTIKAYRTKVTHLFQVRSHDVLVTIGEDDETAIPLLKVWNLEKVDHVGNPLCQRTFRAVVQNKLSKVTCVVVHENLNYMAIGFEQGMVLLLRGTITRERHSRQAVIYKGPHPITGLGFKYVGKTLFTFVATGHHILSVNCDAKSQAKQEILDQHGCSLGSCCMAEINRESQFVVPRAEAVYMYEHDGRGPCLAFKGSKLLTCWHRQYLAVISDDAMAQSSGKLMQTLTLYDVQNRFIAFSSPIPKVLSVLSEWGQVCVVTQEKMIYKITEKDMHNKLDILFKKSLFDQAISLAKSHHYDQDGIADIYRHHGDHLYAKGDFDGAIQQYMRTIGRLEASYVIRRFLDAQRIFNLTQYLQQLHEEGLASEDHTTLLLNCYTKLKDVRKLNDFIMNDHRQVSFEVDTAIKVCRSTGFFEHALVLAQRRNHIAWYLKIQIEDLKDHQAALDFIDKLDLEQAQIGLGQYGKELMDVKPDETTQLLVKLCSQDQDTKEETTMRANPEDFIHIFVNSPKKLMEFLMNMPELNGSLIRTLLELYLHNYTSITNPQEKEITEMKMMKLLKDSRCEYETEQILILCQMHDFQPGILYLYEKAGMYQQILRYHMDHKNHQQVIETSKKFSSTGLWIQTLSYLAMHTECDSEISEVLQHIDAKNLLPPLTVVQTLAQSPSVTLLLVRKYLMTQLLREQKQILEDEEMIEKYQKETNQIRAQISDLKTKAQVFQISKCSACSLSLELPTVHFLCQHSFHVHCFESYSDTESQCPVCSHKHSEEGDKSLLPEDSQQQNEPLDRFTVIANQFGKGIFGKQRDSLPNQKPFVEKAPSSRNLVKTSTGMRALENSRKSPSPAPLPREPVPACPPSLSPAALDIKNGQTMAPMKSPVVVQAIKHPKKLNATASVKQPDKDRLNPFYGAEASLNPFNEVACSSSVNPFDEATDSKNPFEKSLNPFDECDD